MEILKSYGQFDLNKGDGMARGLYNVTNRILLEQTTDEGASFWFDEELKDDLMEMDDTTFERRCKELTGNGKKVTMEDQVVRCPNWCMDGKVKHYPDPERALWVPVNCPFCKGEGEVKKEDLDKIEKKINDC